LPLRPAEPISGVSTPDLRASPSGKESQGAYRMGRPRKFSFTSRAVPVPASVSRSMSSATSSQSSEPGGQVV